MIVLFQRAGSDHRLRPRYHTSAKRIVPVVAKWVRSYGTGAIAVAAVTETGIVVDNTAPEISAAFGYGSRSGLGSGTVIADSCSGPFTSTTEDRLIEENEVSPIGGSTQVIPACRPPVMYPHMLGDHNKAQVSP